MSTPDDFKPELYDWNMLTNAPKENNCIKGAWHILTMAMITDPDWAWSVHCNLAMPIMDTLNCSHIEANNAAAILMKHIFNYDVTQLREFKDIIRRSVSESNGDRTKSLSDKFDPDYAKFGIRNKYDLVRGGKLIPVNPEIPFHQKVEEYFIENAYYSNEKYPWVLFMIGESLNNDSTLFKTIKAGNLGDMERTLIIPNDELNFDDFKLVWNPANEAIEETSAACDASDFLSDLTNRIKEHRSIGSEPCDKDCIVKGTEVNPIAAHREKFIRLLEPGMYYDDLGRHGLGRILYIHSIYDNKAYGYMLSYTVDKLSNQVNWDKIAFINSITFQNSEEVCSQYIKCHPTGNAANLIESLPKNIFPSDRNIKRSDKLQPIETTTNPITSRIEQLNPETKESLLKFLKVRSFFKPNGVYKCKYSDTTFYVYKEYQPHFDRLSFYRDGHLCSCDTDIRICKIDLNDWVFLGIDEPIDPKVQLCQKIKDFFKPGRVYSHRICRSNLRFEGQEVLSTGTILRFIEASMGRLVTHRIDKIDLDDWTDITDTSAASHRRYSFPRYEIYATDESRRIVPTTNELGPQLLFLYSRRGPINSPFHGSRGECIDKLSQADNKNQTYEYEYNSKFLIPWHIYCKTSNRDVLRFERKIPSLQSKVILRFRRVPNNEIVEFSIDEFRRDDWQDITYKLYQ